MRGTLVNPASREDFRCVTAAEGGAGVPAPAPTLRAVGTQPYRRHTGTRARALAAAVALVAVATGASVAPSAAAGERPTRDLPPADQAALARLFDPQLARLGLRTTRAALQDPDVYRRSSSGTHLAIYVEPNEAGSVDREVYARNIMKVARIFLPFVYEKWPGLKSFDVCQEPEPELDPRPAPIPVTQLVATRKGAAALKWRRATLATLIERADALEAKKGGTDPLSLYVSPRTAATPFYAAALARAGLAPEPTSTTITTTVAPGG